MINKVNYYFALVMVILYFAIGFTFLFSDVAIDTFPAYREVIGGLFVLYGTFRLYSVIRKNRRKKENL